MTQQRKRIGLFGGSFNPVHIGHMMLAQYLAQFADFDEVWLLLSPSNPLKVNELSTSRTTDTQRLEMLRAASASDTRIRVCDIELSMPRPSYTVDTLRRLAELHPDTDFTLIIGSDNWLIFDQWRNHQYILDNFRVAVYPRPGYPLPATSGHPNVSFLLSAPQIEISSSFIRESITKGYDMSHFLPPPLPSYIKDHKLYTS